MKRIYIVFVLLLIQFTSSAQWQQTNGPFGGKVCCFASSGTDLFAGTANGVFLSNNNGVNWIQKNNGLSNLNVFSLAVNGSTIYAGTKAGLYQSTNNGNSWSLLSNGIPIDRV